jgi:hypothetical protein
MLNKKSGFKKPQSMFEYQIHNILEEFFDDLESQKTFFDCLSPKGFPLRYDFYSKKHNLLIEADGTQHYDKNNGYYSEDIVRHDEMKKEYCEKNNIRLITIDYKRNQDVKYEDLGLEENNE